MLDQLVESKSHSVENTRRNELLLGITILAVVLVIGGVTKSLFGIDYGLGSGDIELSTLVAPVPPQEEPPPKEEPKPQKDPNVDVRKEIIASMMETPPKVPETISNEKSKIPPRDPNKYTVQGNQNYSAANAPPPDYQGPVNSTGSGSNEIPTKPDTADTAPPPPPVVKKVVPKTISGGVLNGKAISLPKPAYPPAARAVRASGAVQVQVLIDEEGRVVSASAAGGHPLLQAAAVAAARGARFSPTLLSGQPVKVSGIITYNFVP